MADQLQETTIENQDPSPFQQFVEREEQMKQHLKDLREKRKYQFKYEDDKLFAFGNNKRLIVKFKDLMYILPNGQWYSKVDASGFSISGSKTAAGKHSTGEDLQKRLMRHSVEVESICFMVGCGVMMKVGNAHKPDKEGHNWWDQDPFSLKFWTEKSRNGLGEAIEIQFNLGDRKIWVRNPLESEKFLSRQEKDSDVQKVLAEWGAWAKICGPGPVPTHYPRESYMTSASSAITQFATQNFGTVDNDVTFSTIEAHTNDFRTFQVLKTIFYPGVVSVKPESDMNEWGTQALRFISDISDRNKRSLYKCSSINKIVKRFTGREPKTLIKAFTENIDMIIGNAFGPATYNSYRTSTSEIKVFIDVWVKLSSELLKIGVPIEYVVQMIPHMKLTSHVDEKTLFEFMSVAIKEFGYVKVLGLLERTVSDARVVVADEVPVNDAYALQAYIGTSTSHQTPLDHLIEACRILRNPRSAPNPRQLKVFPEGVKARRYYKTAKELHDDLSQQATRYEELGKSNIIVWDKRWKPIHGARDGDLRILLPRSTSVLVRWGKKQKHCIATYSKGMLPFRGAKTMDGKPIVDPDSWFDSKKGSERTILAGVFRGSEILYCMRLEYAEHKLSTSMFTDLRNGDGTDGKMPNPPLNWTLEEFRGFQNKNPEPDDAKRVCKMLETAGVSVSQWYKDHIKETKDDGINDLNRALALGGNNGI